MNIHLEVIFTPPPLNGVSQTPHTFIECMETHLEVGKDCVRLGLIGSGSGIMWDINANGVFAKNYESRRYKLRPPLAEWIIQTLTRIHNERIHAKD